MAQHDYVIANASGATVRADLNNALLAISSNNSGGSDPSTTYAFQFYYDTGDNKLKFRNSANDAYITLGTFTHAAGTGTTTIVQSDSTQTFSKAQRGTLSRSVSRGACYTPGYADPIIINGGEYSTVTDGYAGGVMFGAYMGGEGSATLRVGDTLEVS